MAGAEEILELIDAPGRVALIRKRWLPEAITEVTPRGCGQTRPTLPPCACSPFCN